MTLLSKFTRELLAEIDAAGLTIVPKEPTPEMIHAAWCHPLGERRYNGEVSREAEVVNTDTAVSIYRKMISAFGEIARPAQEEK